MDLKPITNPLAVLHNGNGLVLGLLRSKPFNPVRPKTGSRVPLGALARLNPRFVK